MKNIKCIVGRGNSFWVGYYATPEAILSECRRLLEHDAVVETNDPRFVQALQKMHRDGEIELVVERFEVRYELDSKGDFILPWPDEFFETGFHFLFS